MYRNVVHCSSAIVTICERPMMMVMIMVMTTPLVSNHQHETGHNKQVCLGVKAMHSYATPYAHRDVKPHNILLNPRTPSAMQTDGARFTAVLMDFGSAKPAHVVVMNRNAALAVQEEAEVGHLLYVPLLLASYAVVIASFSCVGVVCLKQNRRPRFCAS